MYESVEEICTDIGHNVTKDDKLIESDILELFNTGIIPNINNSSPHMLSWIAQYYHIHKDIEKMRECYEFSIAKGNVDSMINYGYYLFHHDKNYDEALKLWQCAAKSEDIEAQFFAHISMLNYYVIKKDIVAINEIYEELEKIKEQLPIDKKYVCHFKPCHNDCI